MDEKQRQQSKIRKVCSACSADADASALVCPNCGAAFLFGGGLPDQLRKCKNCHANFDPSVRYCPRCGADSAPDPVPLKLGCVLGCLIPLLLAMALFATCAFQPIDSYGLVATARSIFGILAVALGGLLYLWWRRGAK